MPEITTSNYPVIDTEEYRERRRAAISIAQQWELETPMAELGHFGNDIDRILLECPDASTLDLGMMLIDCHGQILDTELAGWINCDQCAEIDGSVIPCNTHRSNT